MTPRHLQHIVTPARTGARIGRNRHRQPHWAGVAAYLVGAAAFAAALGLVASLAIH
jgi:hypothetical protein